MHGDTHALTYMIEYVQKIFLGGTLMKTLLSALFAGLILAAGAQALAAGCENGACELPEKQNQAYCVGNAGAYCGGAAAQTTRGGCRCYGGR